MDAQPTVQPVQAVVFDLGNTLWFEAARRPLHEVAEVQAARLRPLLDRWGVDLPDLPGVLVEIWDASMDAAAVEEERRTYREISLPFIIRGALAVRGIDLDDQQGDEWWRAAWISVRELNMQLYPDVIDVLAELKAGGITIGINTNRPCTADMLWPDLDAYGIGRYVDVAVCSGDTGYMKPHPSTFELVLEKLALPAAAVAMVGDSATNDMAGARAAGMRTVWKLNGRYDIPPCPDADYAIHDLGELLGLPIIRRRPGALAAAESLTPHEDANENRY